MFWETVAAIFLTLSTFVLWFIAAIAWGMMNAAFSFVTLSYAVLSATPIDWGEAWLVPAAAVISAIQAAWAIPDGIWSWAKYDHPWWALVIGCFALTVLNGSKNR